MIRVLIADDEQLVRAGLRMILTTAADIEVVAEVADGELVLPAVDRTSPDVVLMDIRMPAVDGLTATRRLVSRPRHPQVLVLTTFDLDEYVFGALEAGAAGFLLKDTPPGELIGAVRVIAEGHAMLSPKDIRRLVDRFAGQVHHGRRAAALHKVASLTVREQEVAVAVAKGLANIEIAGLLYCSEATVKAHLTHIFTKTGCDNRVQLALLARDAGLE